MHIRHTKLLNIVHAKKRVAVTELAQALDVSEVTIRKDLSILEHKGLLRREHGYAALSKSDDIGNHLSFNYETKRRIAARAAELVHNGETVMIESGSCCTLLADELSSNRRGITIITNSSFVASYVRKSPGAHIILLGGEYQNESQVVVGPMIQQCLADFNVDKLFIGIDGMNQSGFMSNDLMRSEAIRTMKKKARSLLILTESAKFHQAGVVSLFPFSSVDAVFTDDKISKEASRLLSAAGTRLYTVPFAEDNA